MESEDEIIDICDAEPAAPMMDGEIKSQSDETSHADQLERCGRWLSSIPRDDVMILRQTPEYEDFLRAFESLGDAHRRVASMTRKKKKKKAPSTWNNFSKLTAEDVVLRIFEFLECQSLIRTALTCSRFRQLAHRSATQRTYDVANSRQLNSVMQLLRAKEQIGGVGNGILDSHVRVPILLLSRRVIVTNSGDPDYNGVYFCTGSNGNGFVFTKPRFPERRIQRPPRQRQGFHLPVEGLARPFAQQEELDPPEPIHAGAAAVGAPRADEGPAARFEREVAQPGQLLRCIIAKRFSNETILWYLSKEVETTETRDGVSVEEVTQVFAFWANLMMIGDTTPDFCQYPSQSSVLARHGQAWQALSTTQATRPPTVELLE